MVSLFLYNDTNLILSEQVVEINIYKSVIMIHQNQQNYVIMIAILFSLLYNKNIRSESMERFILKKLLDWKNSPYRKPLILKGVRQVGKTWILKEFGKLYYENTSWN